MITKEQIEKELGYEIQDFSFDYVKDGDEILGISVRVVPKQAVEYIDVNFTLTPSGATFQ